MARDETQARTMKGLRQQGHSFQTIADRFGKKRQSVHRTLKRLAKRDKKREEASK